MGAAFFGVDIVDEAVNRFLIAFVVLQSDFNDRIVLGAVKINDVRGEDFFFAVQVLDEGADPAFVVIRFTLWLHFAFVGQSDGDPLIEKRQFAQAML